MLPHEVLDSPDLQQRLLELQSTISVDDSPVQPKHAAIDVTQASANSSAQSAHTVSRRWRSGVLSPPPKSVLEIPLRESVTVDEFQKLPEFWSAWCRQSWTTLPNGPDTVVVPSVPLWAADLFSSYPWTQTDIAALLEGTLTDTVQPDVMTLPDPLPAQPCPAAVASVSLGVDALARLRREPVSAEPTWSTSSSSRPSTWTLRPIPRRPVRPSSEEVLTRYDAGWSSGVAAWSEEEEESVDEPDVASPVESAPNLRIRSERITKWGRCPFAACQHALRPHLFQTGQRAGSLTLICARWFNKTSSGRDCWGQRPFPMERFHELSSFDQRQYRSLPSALSRNARSG